MEDISLELLFNGKSLNEIFSSTIFLKNYDEYKKKTNIHDLTEFLDNIDTNKKYYRTDIQKNRKYKKETTEDTDSIKNINSMINKITENNYEILKEQIMNSVTKDYLLPYIIETLVEKCILHHRYVYLYVGIIKDINNKTFRCNKIILNQCKKYHDIFFNEKVIENKNQYEHLCNINKRTDNMIGYSLMVTYLEKEKIINGYVDIILDPFMKSLLTNTDDTETYQLLLSFENISSIYFTLIPNKYVDILKELQEKSKSSKIRFKIMDILGE